MKLINILAGFKMAMSVTKIRLTQKQRDNYVQLCPPKNDEIKLGRYSLPSRCLSNLGLTHYHLGGGKATRGRDFGRPGTPDNFQERNLIANTHKNFGWTKTPDNPVPGADNFRKETGGGMRISTAD